MHKIAQQVELTQSYLGELEIALEKVISEWNADLEKREHPERAQLRKKARLSGYRCHVHTMEVATALLREESQTQG